MLDYPNLDDAIQFHCLYTKRGDLTGYGAMQDHLIICVSDGEIIDLIQEAVFEY